MNALKIAIISKANAPGGGASRFAEDLACWLNEAGHLCHHYCTQVHGDLKPFQRHLHSRKFLARASRGLHRKTRRLGFSEILPLDYLAEFQRISREYDILHFHDHFMAYSMTGVALTSCKQKVFFTAHDCLHFSGGCLYPGDCHRFEIGCGKCPQISWLGKWDGSRVLQYANRQCASLGNIQYIYPSQWLLEVSQKAIAHKLRPALAPYGFDVKRYNTMSRTEARNRLGIQTGRLVVCISAHSLGDHRKGVRYAVNAIQHIKKYDPLVLCMGEPSRELVAGLEGVDFWMSGFVTNKEKIACILSASDLFLFCSLEDNLPIAVQESMACATPVVGFATGGVPEMIRDGLDGWLVKTGDQEAVNIALENAVSNLEVAHKCGISARMRLAKDFSIEGCIEKHLALFNS
jgi:glycosyltransferase involved in cell wall biosynthesis